jgi:fumarate hydratase subunit beta
MDPFTPALIEAGLKGMIGKGLRSGAVINAIKKNKAVYFLAPGGAGAYLSERVKKCECIAFEDLGAEAIYMLEVEDFPLVVGVDASGRDIYEKLKAK